jgi:hypothetical protein
VARVLFGVFPVIALAISALPFVLALMANAAVA